MTTDGAQEFDEVEQLGAIIAAARKALPDERTFKLLRHLLREVESRQRDTLATAIDCLERIRAILEQAGPVS